MKKKRFLLLRKDAVFSRAIFTIGRKLSVLKGGETNFVFVFVYGTMIVTKYKNIVTIQSRLLGTGVL
jgi:hypothetical protein